MTDARPTVPLERGFTPALVDPPEATGCVARAFDWLSVGAIGTWLVAGAWPLFRVMTGTFPPPWSYWYVAAFVSYGAALAAVLFLPRRATHPSLTAPVTLAAVQAVTGVAMNALTVRHISGSGAGIAFLVIVAAQLPYFLGLRVVWTWIAVQTIALTVVFFPGDPVDAVVIGSATGGFQMFAAANSILAINQGRARTNLARVNAELTATRELLAENSRAAERLRISRDLHDTLGHHLTALSLQLEVASRLAEGKAVEHLQQAHAITRLLLSDVREVVSELRENSSLGLGEAVRALAAQPVGATVHLDVPDSLVMDDPDRAWALVRAVQEILTNTARHARAANLWIRFERSPNGITLHARDDGQGADTMTAGNGLRGMRERFEQHGGHVETASSRGSGFEVRAFMPFSSATS